VKGIHNFGNRIVDGMTLNLILNEHIMGEGEVYYLNKVR
jgi:hypothetical protein